MCLYSLSVLRVDIAERDSVVGIVASEEKPEKRKTANQNFEITETPKYMKEKEG